MKLQGIFSGCFLVLGLSWLVPATAALSYSTNDDVLRVWGKVEAGDVDALRAKLTPEVRVVVLGDISGGGWSLGNQLGSVIDGANVTTVVHGLCSDWVCPMMFLSGKQRMFSGAGRPEIHTLSFPVIQGRAREIEPGVRETQIPEWWHGHTKLSNSDMDIHHISLFSPGFVLDYLHFFPAQAKFSGGNVQHCSGELMKEKKGAHIWADCFPVSDASALSKGIVTTDEPFIHPSLTVKPDNPVLPASGYAKIADVPDAKVISTDECKSMYIRFLRYDSPRAFVVTNTGGCYARNAQAFQPNSMALKACQTAKGVENCRYYAMNNDVVFVPFDQPLPKASTAVVESK